MYFIFSEAIIYDFTIFLVPIMVRELPKKKVAPGLIDKKGFMILYLVPHCSIALH